MKEHIIVISIIAIILSIVAIYNPHSIEQLPWDSSLKFEKNITPYMVVIIVSIICYSTIFTFINATGLQDTSAHKETTKGTILNIEYSTIRVNNSPRFKVTAKYGDTVNSFDYLDESVQFHFQIGDTIIINYNPDNIKDASIDLQASIENKGQEIESNAKFKILEVTPKFSEQESLYEITGEVHSSNTPARKAIIQEVLSDQQIQRMIPGSILPCLIEGEEGNLRISI